jgi:hypothetical protein
MNYLIHATPVHPSLCLQYLILLFTIATIPAFILLLLLLFHYYHHYKTVPTDKPLRTSLFLGAAELTTHLLRLINILWLPCVKSINLGFTSLKDYCNPLYLWVISPPPSPLWSSRSFGKNRRFCFYFVQFQEYFPYNFPETQK